MAPLLGLSLGLGLGLGPPVDVSISQLGTGRGGVLRESTQLLLEGTLGG